MGHSPSAKPTGIFNDSPALILPHIHISSRTVPLSPNSSVCIGECYYRQVSSKAWVVTGTNKVFRLRDMSEARGSPGVVSLAGWVHVFGGVSLGGRLMNSAERIDALADYSGWENCGCMLTPRRCFNPCVVGRRVYICGGFDTRNSEVFDADSTVYSLLPFLLPDVSEAVTVNIAGDITVITQRHFVVYRTQLGTTEVRTHYEWAGVAGCTNGTVCGGKVYNVALGQVNEFNLTEGRLVRR